MQKILKSLMSQFRDNSVADIQAEVQNIITSSKDHNIMQSVDSRKLNF